MVAFLLLLLLLFVLSLSASPSSDAEALLKFKQSLHTTSSNLIMWKPNTSPCKDRWFGVFCNQKAAITRIYVDQLGLTGTIDVAPLETLNDLRTIRLDNNFLSGPIPAFNRLINLRNLLVSNNNLSGDIPDEFFASIPSLRKVFLDYNEFTGCIPESLMKLKNLQELHLQGNQFSGKIPALIASSNLFDLDLSDNILEGEINETLRKFSAKAFEGNPLLCGKPLPVLCSAPVENVSLNLSPSPPSSDRVQPAVITSLVFMAAFTVLVAIISVKRRRDSLSDQLQKEITLDDNNVGMMIREPGSVQRRSCHGKPALGELVMVNDEKGEFGLQDLMNATAEELGDGSLGSSYKAAMGNGLTVVVKRMREMNKLAREDFHVVIRRLGRLRHPNLLPPLAYLFRIDEKLLVSEYAPNNSLSLFLHGGGMNHRSEFTWPIRLRIIQGTARGLHFLHRELRNHNLPHGNLKASNILLSESCEPLLHDYGFSPLINPDSAPRVLLAYQAPEFAERHQVSLKSDVYCLGIVIIETLTGKFLLSDGEEGTEMVQWIRRTVDEGDKEEVIDPEIACDTLWLDQMVRMLRIGVACTARNPEERPDMSVALRWIEQV